MEPIGERLSRRREELGVSLREAEAATHIRLRYLQAMEEDRFDQLPPDVFAKGFLRAYATYLGLDGTEIVDAFKTLRPSADSAAPVLRAGAPVTGPSTRRRRRRPGRGWRATAVLVVLAAVVGVLLHGRLPAARPAQATRRTPAAAGAPSTAPRAPATASAPASPAVPRLVAGTAQGSLLPFRVTGASTLDVRATFSGPCWVRVWIDGVQQRPDRTLEKGQTASWQGRHSVRILLGNPPQAHLVVDGAALGPTNSLNPLTVSLTLQPS